MISCAIPQGGPVNLPDVPLTCRRGFRSPRQLAPGPRPSRRSSRMSPVSSCQDPPLPIDRLLTSPAGCGLPSPSFRTASRVASTVMGGKGLDPAGLALSTDHRAGKERIGGVRRGSRPGGHGNTPVPPIHSHCSGIARKKVLALSGVQGRRANPQSASHKPRQHEFSCAPLRVRARPRSWLTPSRPLTPAVPLKRSHHRLGRRGQSASASLRTRRAASPRSGFGLGSDHRP